MSLAAWLRHLLFRPVVGVSRSTGAVARWPVVQPKRRRPYRNRLWLGELEARHLPNLFANPALPDPADTWGAAPEVPSPAASPGDACDPAACVAVLASGPADSDGNAPLGDESASISVAATGPDSDDGDDVLAELARQSQAVQQAVGQMLLIGGEEDLSGLDLPADPLTVESLEPPLPHAAADLDTDPAPRLAGASAGPAGPEAPAAPPPTAVLFPEMYAA